MFSALSTKKWGRTCRIAVVFKDLEADEALLRQASDDLRCRFPHFYSKLKRGFFWNYLEQTDGAVEIYPEAERPMYPIVMHSENKPDFRLVYNGKRLALEWAHYITDGAGALTYLKSLTQRYLELAGVIPSQQQEGVLYWADTVQSGDEDDAFLRIGRSGKEAIKEELKEVYRLPSVFENDYLHLIYLKTKSQNIRENASFYGVSVTEYMTAVVMQAMIRTAKEPVTKPVGVDIPVDLRRIFGDFTLRNFVYQVSTVFDPNGRRDCTLEEITNALCGQVQKQLEPEHLRCILKGLAGLAVNPVVRVVPNFIKIPVLRAAQARSHSDETTIITNLGNIALPQPMAEHVDRMELVNGDTSGYGLPATAGMISCNGTFVFCIASSNRDTQVWREVVRILHEDGVPVHIESSQVQERDTVTPPKEGTAVCPQCHAQLPSFYGKCPLCNCEVVYEDVESLQFYSVQPGVPLQSKAHEKQKKGFSTEKCKAFFHH